METWGSERCQGAHYVCHKHLVSHAGLFTGISTVSQGDILNSNVRSQIKIGGICKKSRMQEVTYARSHICKKSHTILIFLHREPRKFCYLLSMLLRQRRARCCTSRSGASPRHSSNITPRSPSRLSNVLSNCGREAFYNVSFQILAGEIDMFKSATASFTLFDWCIFLYRQPLTNTLNSTIKLKAILTQPNQWDLNLNFGCDTRRVIVTNTRTDIQTITRQTNLQTHTHNSVLTLRSVL